MKVLLVVLAVTAFGVVGNCCGEESHEPSNLDRSAQRIAKVLEQFCADCHGPNDSEGDLDLLSLRPDSFGQDADLVRNLLHVLDAREMPPEDELQPSDDQRASLIADLKHILPHAIGNSGKVPRTPVRRMNRFQYNNAVVDLFELKCIVFTLPERAMRVHKNYFRPASGKMPDTVHVGNRPLGKSQMIEPRLAGVAAFPQDLRAEHGYDNRGDHLSLSPLLMEEFVRLGQSITESKDFGPRRVGIWNTFFAEPKPTLDRKTEIRSRLRRFLDKAFRNPVDEELVDRYARFVNGKLDAGQDFTDAMKSVAAAAIASPRFLYLYDTTDETKGEDSRTTLIDDFELASRMSFFLWGSLPDRDLLEVASENKLQDRDILVQQIDRLLTDQKVKRFCDSFPSQWLQLDRIISSVPDRSRFPDFYFSKYRASMHMMMEPLLLFETILIEDRPITQLIDSDFTYRSALLERAYGELGKPGTGKSGVTVLTYHRVPVDDRRNGGVITNAAVMTMTSGPERTQPITRGAWIASVIFNDPPEPPPADVPPLGEKPDAGEENMTLRERLAAHRRRADCRGCHEQIDPLGFALENFNAVGKWRDRYENGREVDVGGRLFRQHEFEDVIEFKDAILADKDRFTRALAGHLLSFALARELGPADEIALEAITKTVAANDYKIKTLIREIILSQPFRTKS